MNPTRTPLHPTRWSPKPSWAVGTAGICAGLATLSLVTLLFWKVSRHPVDGPHYTARMQHCHALASAAARQACVDTTFAQATARPPGRQLATAAADAAPAR